MYSLLLLNGGVGTRVGANQPKQFLKVHGIPILVYSLAVADKIAEISQIVMNYPPGELKEVQQLVTDYAVKTPVAYVEAGETRHESVALLLPHATNSKIIIHEAARPLVTEHDFNILIETNHDNVSLMLPIPFTVAPVDPKTMAVTGALDRDLLRNVQLPQKFDKNALMAAHAAAAARDEVFTEDATLLAAEGYPTYFIEGSDQNFKVTTPTDIRVASSLLQASEEQE